MTVDYQCPSRDEDDDDLDDDDLDDDDDAFGGGCFALQDGCIFRRRDEESDGINGCGCLSNSSKSTSSSMDWNTTAFANYSRTNTCC
jgi:hypothetical protein